MKKIISIIFIAIIAVGCSPMKFPKSLVNYDFPCTAYDDSYTTRGWGYGISANLQKAKYDAFYRAMREMLYKSPCSVEYITIGDSLISRTSYERIIYKDSLLKDNFPFSMEVAYEVECEKTYFDFKKNEYHCFICLSAPAYKNPSFPDEEFIDGEFNRDQFRKYIEEKKKQMLENQKKQ